jgi:hypothetical protein
MIPLAGSMLLLQGVVEMVRCMQCIRTGAWPSREQDVEEVDVDKLKAMVNVKDEDLYGPSITRGDGAAGARAATAPGAPK